MVKHLHRDGFITVVYNDGEHKRRNFDNEIWRHASATDSVCAINAHFNSARLDLDTVKHIMPIKLMNMADCFGYKMFLKYQAHGLKHFVLDKACGAEKAVFLKTVKIVPPGGVPKRANKIYIHTLYKVKCNDDGSFMLKAPIAFHDNEDPIREKISSDCAKFAPFGICLV